MCLLTEGHSMQHSVPSSCKVHTESRGSMEVLERRQQEDNQVDKHTAAFADTLERKTEM